MKQIETILDKIRIQGNNVKSLSDRYLYDGIPVPRTTEILSAMLHEEGLMNWSNSLGFKRIGYRAYLNEAANKGTYTHHSIEHYLRNGIDADLEGIPELARSSTYHAYHSFKLWWECINKDNEIEIIYIEKKLSCKYFGGTLDCLLKINGKIWLIDFKTSNHVGYKYALQMASYIYMLKEEGIEVDGCVILQLSKEYIHYTEHILDFNNDETKEYIDLCIYEFLLLAASYHGRYMVEHGFKKNIK